MADYHTPTIQKRRFIFLVYISLTVCQHVAQAQSPDAAAEQLPQSKQSPADSFSAAPLQFEALSHEVLHELREHGISRRSLEAQRKLILAMERLIGPQQPVTGQTDFNQDPLTLDDPQQEIDSQANEKSLQVDPLTKGEGEAGSSAGQAAGSQTETLTEFPSVTRRENLSDAVWGHLPPQERNDLVRSYSESFLPGYEQQVRQYFGKLARLRRTTPTESSQDSKQ